MSEKIRPPFEEIYMNLAKDLAKRSTCKRRSVGAVLTSTDFRKVLSVGYNGNAEGLPNTCDRDESGNCGCLHAEDNMVINCDSPRTLEKIIFVTTMPCAMCAKRIINLGNVKTVYYAEEYRSSTGKELLEQRGISVRHLAPAGAPLVGEGEKLPSPTAEEHSHNAHNQQDRSHKHEVASKAKKSPAKATPSAKMLARAKAHGSK